MPLQCAAIDEKAWRLVGLPLRSANLKHAATCLKQNPLQFLSTSPIEPAWHVLGRHALALVNWNKLNKSPGHLRPGLCHRMSNTTPVSRRIARYFDVSQGCTSAAKRNVRERSTELQRHTPRTVRLASQGAPLIEARRLKKEPTSE